MNEAEIRAEHIDPALKAAGWGVVDGSRVLSEHGQKKRHLWRYFKIPSNDIPPKVGDRALTDKHLNIEFSAKATGHFCLLILIANKELHSF